MVILEGGHDDDHRRPDTHAARRDVASSNRGLEHELHSEGGCAFFEALAPVPLDHVGDLRGRPRAGARRRATHVARMTGCGSPGQSVLPAACRRRFAALRAGR